MTLRELTQRVKGFHHCVWRSKGAITSKRSQLVLIDDPIKSAASINNPDIRRQMEQTWSNVIAPTMFQGARAICLGTRFHFDDIHATLFVPKNNWKQIIQKAVITDSEGRQRSYWPVLVNEKLNERKMEDRVAFAYQYLNTAVQSSDVGISPDLIVKVSCLKNTTVGMVLTSALD